jgi:hypothetical protein
MAQVPYAHVEAPYPINIGGVRAYNTGDPIPVATAVSLGLGDLPVLPPYSSSGSNVILNAGVLTATVAALVAASPGPFAPSMTGATAPTRYVGGTTSGAPTTGSFVVGDFLIDRTGKVWVCTVAGSPGTWVQAGGGAGGVTSVNGATGAVDLSGVYAQGLAATAVKTAPYTAAPKDYVLVDASGGSVAVTLPTAPADGTRIGIKLVATSATNVATFVCGGSDHLNLTTGPTSGTITLLNQAAILQYASATAVWTVQSSDLPLSQLDTRFALAVQTQNPVTQFITPLKITTPNATPGAWVWGVAGATFNGTPDSVSIWGYNVSAGGGCQIATEPAIYLQMESDYNQPPHTMEAHLDLVFPTPAATTVAAGSNGVTLPQATVNVASTAGWPAKGVLVVGGSTVQYTGLTSTSFTGCTGGTATLATGNAVTPGGTLANAMNSQRPIMIQWRRDTGQLTQFSLSVQSLSFLDWDTGTQFASLGKSAFTLNAFTGLPSSIGIQSPTGQSASLVLGHGGSASTAQFYTVSASQSQISQSGVGCLNFFASRGISVNVSDNSAALVVGASALNLISRFQAAASATGATGFDIIRLESSGGAATLGRFDGQGRFITKVATAPSLANMADGETALSTDASGNLIVTSRVSGALKSATVTVA